MRGERENGDAVFSRIDVSNGRVIVSVIDGLGHGPHAAAAAAVASAQLDEEMHCESAVEILRRMNDRLRGTRGVAATVCVLTEHALSACGVGNVSLRSCGTPVPFVLSPGILGSRVHRFREVNARLQPGDRLLLHSDGISSGFSLDAVKHLGADAACQFVFDAYRKVTDDATVLVMDLAR
ncbi:MAG: SpoIIE family protein phosphatase [Polyangiaceae bacterium]|nr:SpoIIE family protein phosphatase [Polyangiaceae bacterium]